MILALDLGTTAVKAAVVSARGELLAWDAEPHPLILTPDGGVEQDPRVWWATLTRLVQRLLSNAPEQRDAIHASAHGAVVGHGRGARTADIVDGPTSSAAFPA
jgi:sugar (pentulose or hexulose) kinase